MARTRNKTKIPTHSVVEFGEEKVSKRQAKQIEERLNGNDINNKTLFNRIIGGEFGKIKFKNQKQKDFYQTILDHDITICKGSAGTGKTFLAVYAALKALADPNNDIDKIYIIKSVTPLKGEEVGYLKGTEQEKLEGFFSSFSQSFIKLLGEHQYKSLLENKIIEEVGLYKIRGWSFSGIVLVDETQNISHINMRTLLTRYESGKLILLGDTKQVDLKNRNDSSLEFIYDKFGKYSQFGTFEFGLEDVVRNPLIQLIENVFEERELELEEKRKNKNKKQE